MSWNPAIVSPARPTFTPLSDLLGIRVAALSLPIMVALSRVSSGVGGVDLCPFHRMTGLPCPGCGLTRSVLALLHGDVQSSFALNPAGPLIVLVAAFAMVAAVLPRSKREQVVERVRGFEMRYGWLERNLVWLFLLYGLGRIVLILTGITTR